MLDKFDKRVLKVFIKTNEEHTITTIANYLNLDKPDEIENAINELLELNLIKIKHSDLTYTSYILTISGKNYFKTKLKTTFEKFCFPIVLSLITFGLGLLSGLILK